LRDRAAATAATPAVVSSLRSFLKSSASILSGLPATAAIFFCFGDRAFSSTASTSSLALYFVPQAEWNLE